MLAFQARLQASQWWSAEQLVASQLKPLHRLLTHVWHSVSAYRPALQAIGFEPAAPITIEMWQRLTPLARRELQRTGDGLCSTAVPASHGEILTNQTSGSTGMPVTVRGTTFDALISKAFILRHFFWHPYDFSGKFVTIRRTHGAMFEYPHGLSEPRWGDTATFPFETGPSATLSIGASITEQAEWLVRQDPNYLMTFPSNLKMLAAHCREHGLKLPRLDLVTTMAEVLSPDVREECRLAWDVSVIDVYSAQEVGIIALQCPVGEDYHVQSETILVEVVNEQGEPCRPGETGRVLVTPLNNYAMPLLRYDIGDFAVVGAPCKCGRGLPALTRILGRERNALLVTSDGERYWPAFGTKKMVELAPIVQHQFVQKSLDRIEMRLVTERPLTATEERALRDHLAANLPRRFALDFAYVDAIPRNSAGKFEDFVCEVAP